MNGTPDTRRRFMGMPVDAPVGRGDVLEKIREGPLLLSYLNPMAWHVAEVERRYIRNLETFDVIVCDGIALKKALWFFQEIETEIVSLDFSGIAADMLEFWAESGSRVCLVGAEPGIAEQAGHALMESYPSLCLDRCFSGFNDSIAAAKAHILEAEPDVVLAGMGMGLQEAFLTDLRLHGWQGTGIAVGAFFDRLANPKVDYPNWSVRLNVRFLGNVTRRPAYYSKRYLLAYASFYRQVLREMSLRLRRERKRADRERN